MAKNLVLALVILLSLLASGVVARGGYRLCRSEGRGVVACVLLSESYGKLWLAGSAK